MKRRLAALALTATLCGSLLATAAFAVDTAPQDDIGIIVAMQTIEHYGDRPFREGLMPVLVDGAWNYINEQGSVVDLNRGRFSYVYDFFEGRAAVIDKNTNKLGYIDTTGALVIPCQFGYHDMMGTVYTGFFHNGQATVLKEYYPAQEDYSSGFPSFTAGTWEVAHINKAGQLVDSYTAVEGMSAGLYLIGDNGYMTDDISQAPVEEPAPSDWAKDEVDKAIAAGLVPELTGNPGYQDNITREQFAELIVRCVETALGREIPAAPAGTFSDCDNLAILKAAQAGIVTGVGGDRFDPFATTNREQIATMIYRAVTYLEQETGRDLTPNPSAIAGFTDAGQVSGWAAEAMGVLAANNIMKGSSATTLSPQNACSVEQSILLSWRTYACADPA